MNEEHTHDDDREYPVSLDEKLVAHLLGETDAEVSAEVEAALAADPALQTRRDELQAALGVLRTPEFAPALAPERRDELRAAAAQAGGTDAAVGGSAGAGAGASGEAPCTASRCCAPRPRW